MTESFEAVAGRQDTFIAAGKLLGELGTYLAADQGYDDERGLYAVYRYVAERDAIPVKVVSEYVAIRLFQTVWPELETLLESMKCPFWEGAINETSS